MSTFIDLDSLFNADEDPGLVLAPPLAHVLHHGFDFKKRTVYLDGVIDETTGPWFWTIVNQMGPGKIFVELNTPGGDVDSMFSVHDAIRRHGNVEVHAYGQCCSAGVLILACGHHRGVSESLVLMSHESTHDSGELGYRAAKDRRKVEDWQHIWWCELMSRYTGKDAGWWKRTTERQAEYWLLGGAAVVEAGIADWVG